MAQQHTTPAPYHAPTLYGLQLACNGHYATGFGPHGALHAMPVPSGQPTPRAVLQYPSVAAATAARCAYVRAGGLYTLCVVNLPPA